VIPWPFLHRRHHALVAASCFRQFFGARRFDLPGGAGQHDGGVAEPFQMAGPFDPGKQKALPVQFEQPGRDGSDEVGVGEGNAPVDLELDLDA
jgi:hypothetical protein